MPDSQQVQMAQAIRRQMDQRDVSQQVDRTGWTRRQWVDDARILMNHEDGAITSLVNGHIMALLAEVNDLSGQVEWLRGQVVRLKDGPSPGRTITCQCDTGPTSDGPEQDCPVHGDVRWYAQWLAEARETIETLTEQVAHLEKA